MSKKELTIWSMVGLMIALVALDQAGAAEWGSLKGRFVVDGAPPTLPPLQVTKDKFCIQTKPVNETVVIGENGGLANAVVYVFLGRRGKIDIHPDYEAQMSEPIELDNKGCAFHPHVLLIRTNQPFILKNSDPVGHNTNTGAFNEIIPSGEEREKEFTKSESLPSPVSCNIHPFMKGVLLVQDHPYMASSAEDGTFEIKNLPAGEFNFQFWHEAPGYLRDVNFNGGSTDRRGRAKLTIPAGGTLDLGDIKVPASSLQ